MERFTHILILALLSSVHCSANTDRSALLALKAHITSDPHNLLLKNWTTKTSFCNWVGITCDPLNNRVTELNISNMQLVGTIPPEIGNLSSLVSLDMNENSFYGPIPASIFNLSSIQVITLRGNALSSQLPIDMCENLHNLKLLRISFNKLNGEIPSSLGKCSNLEVLSLYNNSLVGGVPKEIGNLTHLTQLYLGFNILSGTIPGELFTANIKSIDLSNNHFHGSIPLEIERSTNLTYLNLANNDLLGFIPSPPVQKKFDREWGLAPKPSPPSCEQKCI